MQDINYDSKLLEIHKLGRGFIFNDFSGRAPSGREYNILHNASCSWILKCNTNVHKLFFEDEIEAIEWLSTNRVSNWKLCGTCKPSLSLIYSNPPIKPSPSLETKGLLKS
ncbi:Uncharacterised protein [uncultured archaeon]|nr:Uncharacterised protein [uncultured archaeon]